MNGPQMSPRHARGGTLSNSGSIATAAQQQPIMVRVMRLSRPKLMVNPAKLPLSVHGGSLDTIQQTTTSVFSDELAVPSVFGRVAVGEQLCFLISLVNVSSADVKALKVRVDLQKRPQATSNAFILAETLADTSANPIAAMKSGQRLEFACSTTVKEAVMHSLVCTVSYDRTVMTTDPVTVAAMNGQVMAPNRSATPEIRSVPTSYSKHFNFGVTEDIRIATRTASLFPEAGHTWLVEATVECFVPVHITGVHLCTDPTRPEICVEDISTSANCVGPEPTPQPSSAAALAGAKWNLDGFPAHLPRFRDIKGITSEKTILKKTFRVTLKNGSTTLPNSIGVLKVDWRSTNCECGHAEQTVGRDTAKEKNAKMDGIDVLVEKESDTVDLYQSFDVTCTIKNSTRSDLSLLIAYNESRELTPAAVSSLTASLQSAIPAAGCGYGSTLAVALEAPSSAAPSAASKQPASSTQQDKQQQQVSQQPQTCGMIINGSTCDPDPVKVPAGGEYKHKLSLLPVQLGLCSLGSLLFYDINTGASTPCSDIGTVFVKAPDSSC